MIHLSKKKTYEIRHKGLIYIEYAESVKGYNVYEPATKTCRDIVIMETCGDQNIVQKVEFQRKKIDMMKNLFQTKKILV